MHMREKEIKAFKSGNIGSMSEMLTYKMIMKNLFYFSLLLHVNYLLKCE